MTDSRLIIYSILIRLKQASETCKVEAWLLKLSPPKAGRQQVLLTFYVNERLDIGTRSPTQNLSQQAALRINDGLQYSQNDPLPIQAPLRHYPSQQAPTQRVASFPVVNYTGMQPSVNNLRYSSHALSGSTVSPL